MAIQRSSKQKNRRRNDHTKDHEEEEKEDKPDDDHDHDNNDEEASQSSSASSSSSSSSSSASSSVGEQIRVSLTLAPDVRDRSLQVSAAPLAVPADLTRSGLSSVLNHLLLERISSSGVDVDDDHHRTHTIDFDFILTPPTTTTTKGGEVLLIQNTNANYHHRLLRGGIEAHARKLGLSLEEAVPITYFPSLRYRPTEPDSPKLHEPLPDWISALSYSRIVVVNSSSSNPNSMMKVDENILLCGCYDGSLHAYRNTAATEPHTQSSSTRMQKLNATIRAHAGPIKCLATESVPMYDRPSSSSSLMQQQQLWMASGSIDQTLCIHQLVASTQASVDDDEPHPSSPISSSSSSSSSFSFQLKAHCVGGHSSSIESVALASTTSSSLSSSDNDDDNDGDGGGNDHGRGRLWLASGDASGGVCLWDGSSSLFNNHHHHNDANITQQTHNVNNNNNSMGNKKAKHGRSTQSSSLFSSQSSSMFSSQASPRSPPQQLSPMLSLRAHSGLVSGIAWHSLTKSEHYHNSSSSTINDHNHHNFSSLLLTGSWDHSIKVWDIERQNNLLTLNGSKVVTCLASSHFLPGVVASGHPDCVLRLWDVRIGNGSGSNSSGNGKGPALSTTTNCNCWNPSHRNWISHVAWADASPYHVLSASHDGTVKVWDVRSSLPLQTIRVMKEEPDPSSSMPGGAAFAAAPSPPPHKVLCVAFANHDRSIVAGGTDCTLHEYSTTTYHPHHHLSSSSS